MKIFQPYTTSAHVSPSAWPACGKSLNAERSSSTSIVNLARLRHSTVGDQLAEFANRNTNAGGRFRLGESKHNRQRWQDVTQTAVHGFPRKTHERPHPSVSGYRCDKRSPRYPRPSLRLS